MTGYIPHYLSKYCRGLEELEEGSGFRGEILKASTAFPPTAKLSARSRLHYAVLGGLGLNPKPYQKRDILNGHAPRIPLQSPTVIML